MAQKTVLITGGTGLVGTRLTEILLERGYRVSYLSRRKEMIPNVEVYRWDVEKGYIEDGALETADYVVLLAGAGIADQRWTDKRKQEIINSRTKGIELLTKELQSRSYQIKACVAASGVGFYGADTGNEHLEEDDESGTDYISHVTRQWETASERIQSVGIRTSILRIGIVLSSLGGALPRMLAPVRWGVGASLGTGRQWVSWIHIDDLCEMMIQSIENENYFGIFNAVAPNPVTNATLMRQIATVTRRPFWLPNVPSFIMRLMLGEMANLVLGGNYVLNKKIKVKGFNYQFSAIENALEDLLVRK